MLGLASVLLALALAMGDSSPARNTLVFSAVALTLPLLLMDTRTYRIATVAAAVCLTFSAILIYVRKPGINSEFLTFEGAFVAICAVVAIVSFVRELRQRAGPSAGGSGLGDRSPKG